MSEPIYASKEAEQAVLGSLLLDDRCYPEVRAKIEAADFFYGEHRQIFTAISKLAGHGTSVDVVTVAEAFSDSALAEIGGARYLSHLVSVTPDCDNAGAYADIVKRESIKRSAIASVSDLYQALQSDSDPSELLLQFRDDAAKLISPSAKGIANLYEQFLFNSREAMDTDEPEWLIDGYLPDQSLSVIYGKSEAFKSFIALDMCCAISTGQAWHGNETLKSPVLYICAEGQRGINYRKRAWELKHSQNADLLGIYGQALDMTDPAIAVSLGMAIDRFESQFDMRPKLMVIDTMNRCFGDGDENSTQDATRFIHSIDAIRSQTGIGVLIIHHSGKDETKGMRGNSVLRAAMDTEFLVTRPDADAMRTSIRNTKIKDADRPPELFFDMMSVDLKKQDRKGNMMRSLVPQKSETRINGDYSLIVDLVQKALDNGRVPNKKFISDEWRNCQPIGADPEELKVAFGMQMTAAVRNGEIWEDSNKVLHIGK